MAYVARGSHRTVITASVQSFKERATEIQRDLDECEEKNKGYISALRDAKKRIYVNKQEGSKLRLRMQDVIEKIDRAERSLEVAKDRLYQAKRRTDDNLEVSRFLQTPKPDLEELVKSIHQANQYGALMRSNKAAAAKKFEGLEEKIQKAERRFQKADDFVYTINQKIAVHRQLMGNPEVSRNYRPMKDDEYSNKVNTVKEKIRQAAIRTRRAEERAAHLDKRLHIMDDALDNYDRRICDFQKGKREIMGSK